MSTHNSHLDNKANAKIFNHPGFKKNTARSNPKGRTLNPRAQQEIGELLKGLKKCKSMTIEYLHLIQDKFGYISTSHICALASALKLSQAEINESASFYAHFDIVGDDETAPAKLTIRVCSSISCKLMGADSLKLAIENGVKNEDIRVIDAPCMGRCDFAPIVEVGHNHITKATEDAVISASKNGDIHPKSFDYQSLSEYLASGGYKLFKSIQSGKLSADEIIKKLQASGLRGLGGAGFPLGKKWELVRANSGEKLMAVNADEGEPGTLKDYHYLKQKPHQFLEGVLIGASVIEARDVYIYLRDEYPDIRKMLEVEIEALSSKFALGIKLHLRRGAGAYICGEESAMLESIEGKRGWPRKRPPFVASVGLWGKPTLVNNVESLYWCVDILNKQDGWFKSFGANGRVGFRSFSVSGRVKKAGVHLAPAGITALDLINDFAGGMEDGHTFKAYLPGGASGGILPASMSDIPLDFDTLNPYGCFIGSAAVIVLSNADNMVDVARNLMQFFEDESCGQCTPCRVGTTKIMDLINKEKWDIDLIKQITTVMQDASICGLGQAAPNPLLCVIEHFSDEIKTT